MIGYKSIKKNYSFKSLILINFMIDMESKICEDCGNKTMRAIGDINSTRLFICLECYNERHEFLGYDSCKHEYFDKNGNRCIHCGEESINYGV